MEIKKRNGEIVIFDKDKISDAIVKAMLETDSVDIMLATKIACDIEIQIKENYKDDIVTVEEVQDMVEEQLMETRKDVAKRYILYREERRKVREKGWNLDELQTDIWKGKYQFENETFDEFLDRVSNGNEKIRKIMLDKEFLFAGRILANRGLQKHGKKITYSNCYVVKAPEDNIESILDSAKEMARTFSYGGGCGISLRNLRPRGSKINNAAEETTGSVSFMHLYDVVTDTISQKGRRGALMIELPINHPDIEEFINVKLDLDKITKANISIRMYDDFMRAYQENKDYKLSFDVKETDEKIEKLIEPNEVLRQIATNNYKMGEPGMLFQDRIDSWHMLSEEPSFEYESVNPCAEEPLVRHGNCLLGSINLSEFVLDPFTSKARVPIDKLSYVVRQAVIALNEVLEEGIPLHPLKEQREASERWRPIGLGVMGFADMLIKLGISYGSYECLELSNLLGKVILNEAVRQSALIAKEAGTYPGYTKNILKSPFFIENLDPDVKKLVEKYGMRNSHVLSIAPTGSISTMLGISGGIEPLFATSYERRTQSLHDEDIKYKVYPHIIKEVMNNLDVNEESLPDYIVTAHNIHWVDRINTQSVWQKYIDASISSTINLPEESTIDEIENLYYYAWKTGCKGVTIYRNNCDREGILTVETKEDDNKCKNCGAELEHKEGCISCPSCGWGACTL